MPDPVSAANGPVLTALRVASASVVCLVISELFHLQNAYQSLVTVHIVNMTYPAGPFQKGIERLIGRTGGVFYGAVLAVIFAGWPGLIVACVVVFQLGVWYLNAAGRLPYAGLHLGLFSATTAAIGLFGLPSAAVDSAVYTAVQILIGVVVAEWANLLAADAGPIRIDTGSNALFPPRPGWVAAAVRMTAASTAAMFVAGSFDLPLVPTMISAMLVTQAGEPTAAERKAYLRMLGAIAGVLYCLPVLQLMARLPAFALLLGFIALAIYVGQVIARSSATYSYFGFQFGLTVGLILAGPPAELSDLNTGLQRIVGVVCGTAVAIVAVALIPAPRPAAQ